MVGALPLAVVDLGAGTGKLTRTFVALGHRVIAVEPLEEMRAELAAALPAVHALHGSAEAIPLYDGAADVVTSAQAFHWFDHDDALPEIARVLRPGGHLALVWNSRDDRDPWMARLSAIIGNETIEESDVVPVLDASGLFGPVETAVFSFVQTLERDGLLDLVLSRSYPPSCRPAERQPVLDAVGRSTTRRPARRAYGSRTSRSAFAHGARDCDVLASGPKRTTAVEMIVVSGGQEEIG